MKNFSTRPLTWLTRGDITYNVSWKMAGNSAEDSVWDRNRRIGSC